uniref:Uncharacterized protein n=1 Tax=Parascaris univalens TaxID=6257 RepID=A0A914ZQ58_PARUN
MSKINGAFFERVTFGTRRLPAWQRWEGISDRSDEKSRSLNSMESTSFVKSMPPNEDTLSHSYKKRIRHRGKVIYNEHRVRGDIAVNHTDNIHNCDAHFWEERKMHSGADLIADATYSQQESTISSSSDEGTMLSVESKKVGEQSLCSETGSPGNDTANPIERVLTADENNSIAGSDGNTASISSANTPPPLSTKNISRKGSNLLQPSSSVNDSKNKARLIIGEDDGDRQQILICNGHVDTVIFGPCTVKENKPHEEQSEELKYRMHKISENCTQVKELCALLLQLTSQLAVKVGTLENKIDLHR